MTSVYWTEERIKRFDERPDGMFSMSSDPQAALKEAIDSNWDGRRIEDVISSMDIVDVDFQEPMNPMTRVYWDPEDGVEIEITAKFTINLRREDYVEPDD